MRHLRQAMCGFDELVAADMVGDVDQCVIAVVHPRERDGV